MDWCLTVCLLLFCEVFLIEFIDTPIAKMQPSGACRTRTAVRFADKAGALHEHHAFFSVHFFAIDQARL